MRARESRIKQRWDGPFRMTFEVDLKHESEPAMASSGISVFKGPGAGRDLAGEISRGRCMW